MSVVELARPKGELGESHVYQIAFVVGAVFICQREPSNSHSSWAIVIKNPESKETVGHVPDYLPCVLFPLLTSGLVISMKCEVTSMSKAAKEGV